MGRRPTHFERIRFRAGSQRAPRSTFTNANSEIFNKFGPVSKAEGVPCATVTSGPPDPRGDCSRPRASLLELARFRI